MKAAYRQPQRLVRWTSLHFTLSLLAVAILALLDTVNPCGLAAPPAPLPQGAGYTYRRTITIDHAKVPNTDQNNFPVLISGTYSFLKTVANGGNVQNANGYDVIFASDSSCANKLNHEVETYNASAGAVNYWVKVPTVSHTTDTLIYICYGNSSVTTDQSNKTAVWDANYKGVWHVPNGSTLTTTDSTANANHGTNNSATALSGTVGGAASFNGSSQNISIPATIATNTTVEHWVYRTGTADFRVMADAGWNGTDGFCTVVTANAGGQKHGFVKQAVAVVYSTSESPLNTWEHVVWTVGADNKARLHVNGVLTYTDTDSQAIISQSHGGSLGSRLDAAGNPFKWFPGNLDEIRISNMARSSDWIATEYNNQSSPSTFYSISDASGTLPPVANAGGPYSGLSQTAIQFNGSGNDPDGTIVGYSWVFGDGGTGTGANAPHTYSAPGTYNATLTVTDDYGATASANATVTVTGTSDARLDSMNRTGGGGEDPLSRNFNWSVPLVSLPGRSGLNLGLSLSYNSLVWTKTGNYIYFDDDQGFPAPGFRLGFPVIQPSFYNAQAEKYSYLLITPSGARVELRQVGTSSLYQAVDSSYLLLDTTAGKLNLRSADGTELSFSWQGSNYQCKKIQDRNGNFITISYDNGRIDKVTDTLAREIRFNYTNGELISITQTWTVNGQQQPTYTWATFTYDNKIIQTNFTGLTVLGPQNGSTIRALTQVRLADQSHYDFDYTSWGQVRKVTSYASDEHVRNYRGYNLPLDPSTAQTDCPRFTLRWDWARNWNGDTDGITQTGEEALTFFTEPSLVTIPNTSETGILTQVKLPDQTYQRTYFGSANVAPAWRYGLPLLTETYDAGDTKQRWVVTTWEQDDQNAAYRLNPRLTETNIYDPSGNHSRTRTVYAPFSVADGTTVTLPTNTYEYKADATNYLRHAQVSYKAMTAPYVTTTRRVIGLVDERKLYDATTNPETLMARVAYKYDDEVEVGSIQGNDAPVQHDTTFNSSFVNGRGNVSKVTRYDVNNQSLSTSSTMQHNTAGSVVKATDAAGHYSQISYADQFAANSTTLDSGLPSTLAYPTTVTDPDGYTAKTRYNYHFGAPTWKQTPLPNVTDNQPGPEQKISYDNFGRIQRVTNLLNNAYTRFIYGPNYVETWSTVNTVTDEAHSLQVFDGQARVIGKGSNHPDSAGGFSGQLIIYDQMGRVTKQSNPTETSVTITGVPISPASWQVLGDDAPGNIGVSPAPGFQPGWWVTTQTYDWNGRPLVTTNVDNTTMSASYSGCGCAGGEVVTLTDEVGRQQKAFSDVLGRQWKSEVLDSSGTVYSATTTSYNARDQIIAVNRYKGSATSDLSCPNGTCMQTATTYDGYGRVATHKLPQQTAPTSYAYNSDNTLLSVTDPRGVIATNSYNNRHLLTGVSYTPAGGVPSLTSVAFAYDAAGNRISMSDGTGSAAFSYDQLSRMTSETKTLSGLSNSYVINYGYNVSGMLTSVTDPSGAQAGYNYDMAGRLSSMPASGYGGVTNFLSNTQYRASGAMKHATYGNNVQLDLTYNSRMQIGQYQVSGFQSPLGTMGATMSYHADGRTNTAFDLNDARFDRKYEFDFAARLKEAYSGVEAHGAPPPPSLEQANSPYRQSYTYDQWNNATLRSGRIWSVQSEYETASYNSNNKREYEFTYDDAGNVIWSNGDGARSYDAAGRPVTFASAQYWQLWPNWPTNPPHPTNSPALETIDTFDGAGHVVKIVKTTRNDATQDWGNGPIYLMAESTTTTYCVHSTVLGGKTVVELDGSGVKTKGYIYAGGSRIATHHVSTGGSVELESTNPVTGSAISTDVNGSYVSREEPDPLGRELSTPPDPMLVLDPIANSKFDEPRPIEYAPNWTGEMEIGMAHHLDVMDMVSAREALKRWLRSERTSNAEYSTWLNILNKNPNVGIAAGKKTLWGKDAGEYLKNNAASIILGDGGIFLQDNRRAPARRILLIVGQPGIQQNVGPNFMRAAKTRQENLRRFGSDAFIVQAATETDLSAALVNNGMLDGVEYFGHSGPNALFIGDGYSDEVTLDSSEVSQLSNRNLNWGATIILHGCNTAVGDRQSFAAKLSVQLERTTFGYDQDSVFSSNPDHRTGAVIHPSRGPTYMVPWGGGGISALRGFAGALWPTSR